MPVNTFDALERRRRIIFFKLDERIFLMKDLAAIEEAVGLGTKIVDGKVVF
jgi:hypothetical protein